MTLVCRPNTVFAMRKFHSSLCAGDILLGLDAGETSEAIVALDRGTYSHAAIWSRDGVIESTTPHVVEWSLEQSLGEQPRAFIDVYRHRNARAGAAIVAEARRFSSSLRRTTATPTRTWFSARSWSRRALLR